MTSTEQFDPVPTKKNNILTKEELLRICQLFGQELGTGFLGQHTTATIQQPIFVLLIRIILISIP